MFKKVFLFSLLIIFLFISKDVFACDSWNCALSRSSASHSENQKFLFDFSVEQQNWDVIDPHVAHTLHHQGHHVHDKTHEEFYHFTVALNPNPDWTVLIQLPYVVRNFLDIEHHDTLGKKMSTEGFGDLDTSLIYKFLRKDEDFLGILGGVKFPTGSTDERDDDDMRFEPELQPGSGSYDYTIGAVFNYSVNVFSFHGNMNYVFKNEGHHDFEFGDVFSTYLVLDYLLNPDDRNFRATIGVDLNWQVEGKQTEEGERINDSGGTTVLLGPSISVEASKHLFLFGNFLFPIHQNPGGVHQELDYAWNAGAKIIW